MKIWPDTGRQRVSKVITYTLLCFALAGLIVGFTLGGLVRRHFSTIANDANTTTANSSALAPHSKNAAVTENVQPGNPIIRPGEDYLSPQKADGATSYKLSTQIVYKNSSTPIQTSDVTCRLWLTKDPDVTQAALSANNYALPRSLAAFHQPFPGEVPGVLNFTPPGQQVQPCVAHGKTTWTYTISPGVDHGTYYLAVLADWKGQHYNWYLVAIKVVAKGNQGGN